MNTHRSFVIALAVAAGFSLAWAQDPSPPGTQTPVRQPQTSPPLATPVPAPAPNQTSTPSPSQPAPAAAETESTSQAQPVEEEGEETVPPPRRLAEGDDGATDTLGEGRNCTRLRGIEKAECERRDNPRDDLPAGVTSSQKP
jgi:hypothetical protein